MDTAFGFLEALLREADSSSGLNGKTCFTGGIRRIMCTNQVASHLRRKGCSVFFMAAKEDVYRNNTVKRLSVPPVMPEIAQDPRSALLHASQH